MAPNALRRLRLFLGIAVILCFVILPAAALAQTNDPGQDGEYYVVKRGDSWTTIAAQSGLSVAELKAANPAIVRPYDWLWVGDRLYIPASGAAQPVQPTSTVEGGYWFQVRPGDNWYSVSLATGAPVIDLWRANPDRLRPDRWLYYGEWLWVPEPGSIVSETPEATETPATVDATPVATAAMRTPSPTRTPRPTSSPTPRPTALPPTATPRPAAAAGAQAGWPDCPAEMAGYPEAILNFLNEQAEGAADVNAWLANCGALLEDQELGSVTEAAIQSNTTADLVIVVHDPATTGQIMPTGMLLVYHATPQGYALAGQASGTGRVALLELNDVNNDLQADILWTDTTCGAHTCFTTLFVDSWDGTVYEDWVEGEPVMADSEFTIKDTLRGGSGKEIILHGGVIGSAGAGPQRAWTETYASINGKPYKLASHVYDEPTCVYHQILDANQIMADWASKGFEPAVEAYQIAVEDEDLGACWNLENEVEVLRDFARFRLAIAATGAGRASHANTYVGQITDPDMKEAGEIFLDSFESSGSIIQACRDADAYATAHPESWVFLTDWGYANPSFEAKDFCPLD